MSAGRKIIEGLEAAVNGDLLRVTIEGQTWVRLAVNNDRKTELLTPGEANAYATGFERGRSLQVIARERRP